MIFVLYNSFTSILVNGTLKQNICYSVYFVEESTRNLDILAYTYQNNGLQFAIFDLLSKFSKSYFPHFPSG